MEAVLELMFGLLWKTSLVFAFDLLSTTYFIALSFDRHNATHHPRALVWQHCPPWHTWT